MNWVIVSILAFVLLFMPLLAMCLLYLIVGIVVMLTPEDEEDY